MARKKKNDFWDEPEDMGVASSSPVGSQKKVDEEWSAVKSLPLKIFVRILLMVACLVALFAAYIAYDYVEDRYAGGSYSTDFYDSASFAEEYNKCVDQLLQLVQAMEADPTITQTGNEEILATLVENYMGKDTNFSFMILDGDNYKIASSGDDAKSRIESSTHYMVISNVIGEMTVQSPISGSLLNKSAWNKILSKTGSTYTIYTAVDEELAQSDGFYTAAQNFEKMEEYFSVARFVGIVAAVIFIICLIYCILSTGMKSGYDEVCLSWFDKVYTELSLIIMVAVAGGIVYAIRYLMNMNGKIYQYGSLVLVVVAYVWIIRAYFSLVRRIKAGTLLNNSMVGAVARYVSSLPSPINVVVGVLLLLVVNAALVASVLFLRHYTIKGVPIVYIIVPVIVILELVALIVCNGSDDEDDEETLPTRRASVRSDDEEEDILIAGDVRRRNADREEQMDWEALDLGKAIAEAEQAKKEREQTKPNVMESTVVQERTVTGPVISNRDVLNTTGVNAQSVAQSSTSSTYRGVSQKTEILSVEDVRIALAESGLTPQKAGDVATERVGVMPEVTPVVQTVQASQTEQTAPVVQETQGVQNIQTAQMGVQTVAGNQNTQDEIVVQTVLRPTIPLEADDGRVNFVQLNKDVRKEFRTALKGRGIGVTVRAPEKPVIIDIDRNSLHMIISNIFSQVERLCAQDARTYVEIYLQGGKVVYIVKIPVATELMPAAVAAVGNDGSFESAKKIIEANDGKFVVNMDGTTLKVGMLIDAAE